jgi:choline dehydrogenase-like flavoprotein
LFADTHTNDNLTASGVEFIYDEKTYVTYTNKEVILSAGYVPCVSRDRT